MTCRLQLSLTAKNLTNLSGLLGKSDPFAVVTVRGDNPDNRPVVVGQTDVVFNNLNPTWATVIFLEGYKFGVPFYIEVGVFDFQAKQSGQTEQQLSQLSSAGNAIVTSSASSRNLLKNGKFPHKVMGTALFEVGEILGSRGNVGSKSLQTGGAIYVHLERCREDGARGKLKFKLRALNLTNVQTLGRTSCPFFELYRRVERPTGATWTTVFRSNVVKSNLNPIWEEDTLDMEALCNGDQERSVKIIVWDFRRGGKHKMMGEVESSARQLIEAGQLHNGSTSASATPFALTKVDKNVGELLVSEALLLQMSPSGGFEVAAPKEAARNSGGGGGGGGGGDNHGGRPAQNVQVKQRPEFVDYLTGGCKISLAVAIDFTASNGDPRQEGTPHYFHPPASKEWNDYEKAIFAVGSILAKYDSDQRFPVWGFGAKYNGVVRHCFQCGTEVEVQGVQGIMDAYRGVFRTPLTMSYPTIFTEVISTASSYAKHEQEVAEEEGKLSYTILLILTAGNIENVRETKRQLIAASSAPLSVVIVGIGDADFSGMEFLDEHDPNTEEGRDITKFVRFSDYKSYNALTEAVLDEIPDQLVDFFYERGVLPGKVEDYDHETVHVQPADDDERTFTFLG